MYESLASRHCLHGRQPSLPAQNCFIVHSLCFAHGGPEPADGDGDGDGDAPPLSSAAITSAAAGYGSSPFGPLNSSQFRWPLLSLSSCVKKSVISFMSVMPCSRFIHVTNSSSKVILPLRSTSISLNMLMWL